MDVRKLINDSLFYSTKNHESISFGIMIMNQETFPVYGIVGTMDTRFAFMPVEGKMIVANKKMSFDSFANKTNTFLLPKNDIFYLYTFYETVRLGFIGKAAMTIAYEVATNNIKDNVFNCYNLSTQLMNILKDLEEPLSIAYGNERVGNALCPICTSDNIEVLIKGERGSEIKCNACNVIYKYYYDKKQITIPASSYSEVLETMNEMTTTFVI